MSECSVCCLHVHQQIQCPDCEFMACSSCILHYFFEKPSSVFHCMSCFQEWETSFFLERLSKKEIRILCKKRKEWEDTKNQSKQPKKELLQKYNELKLQKKKIEKEMAILRNIINQKDTKLNIIFCPKKNCDGTVHFDTCFKCKTKVCKDCLGEWENDHTCFTSGSLLTIKPCPACKVPITRESGCPQMFCVHCKTGFSWNTLEIINRVENPHYWQDQEKIRVEIDQLKTVLSTPDKLQKWIKFLTLIQSCDKERKLLLGKETSSQKQKLGNQSFSEYMHEFVCDGLKLIRSLVETKSQVEHQEMEFKMFLIMKEFNDHCIDMGERLKINHPPRIIGWKIVN